MIGLVARRVDPRDQSWEIANPAYRVYFAEGKGVADEWRIENAKSVQEAIQWALETRGERKYTLYVEVGFGLEIGLIEIDRL